jgi:hypothetical protein
MRNITINNSLVMIGEAKYNYIKKNRMQVDRICTKLT